MFSFVKKILLTGNNDISTLQKSLYCIAKQALLPCKTGSFALQNNGYCNTLIISSLGEVPLLKNTLHCFANSYCL